jgi:hypothetical protein
MSDRGHPRRRPGPAFDFREENGRWSIRDVRRDAAAVINGVPQTGLDLAEAEELTAVLNRLDAQRAARRAGQEG